MRKRIRWSANLAYAVGLITTDGNLSKDGRHIELTSKDLDQLNNFSNILHLSSKISFKVSGYTGKKISRIQFSNVKLYRFLIKIGLTPCKTKTLKELTIPDKYYCDFLRGHLDGDGWTYSYYDPRWKSSFMLYTVFMSASKSHLEWMRLKIKNLYNIEGKISYHKRSYYHLRFAKKSSLSLLSNIYYKKNLISLQRKRFKIDQSLGIIGKQAGML